MAPHHLHLRPVRTASLNRHAPSPTSAPTSAPRELCATTSSSAISSTHAISGRLHKRGGSSNSNSSLPSPIRSHSPDISSLPSGVGQDEGRRSLDLAVHSARKLRPYLRRLHTRDDVSLDLSVPAPDLDSPSGLGIHEFRAPPRSATDVTFAAAAARHRHVHNRSTSGNSDLSNSSGRRQPTQPTFLRNTPRQFSDLSEHSQPPSIYDEDCIAEAGDIMSDDEYLYRQHAYDPRRRSGSMSSTPNAPAPLHSASTGSVSRLGSRSQTSLSNLYDPARQRRDTMRSETATSPSSRTSLDRAIGFVRGRESPVDPASRAASIRALRAEFQAKEEAKERKAEKEAAKRRDREERKRAKLEERHPGKPEMEEINEKADSTVDAGEYSSAPSSNATAHNSGLPPYVLQSSAPKPQRSNTAAKRPRPRVKSRWATFVAWFRTRLLRLKCI
ncbi:hypothetical protein BFW01_g6683 [Lasiodiplodia theobromae]|uniref:Uncharacterized protein n=1 Tax=Lasiodiplodia theobromae TaxID=45133 RepID=A0A5N5DSN3_9PEZI|nr:uncharacterized protein LTHEOB_7517 [Lasiodiplodia theobromae]KAB2580975.1 hypothetical protein DBV05_g654 [Lasiodiplodia theobromae]KAF4542325.1 hypothetical protein LTHEOB_7517 [Lasiodiplodia theobromae]KAF9635788.1 hypothetical protein BFW01_g6683 [Lasiodiplodia theobromae]